MSPKEILFDLDGVAISPGEIRRKIFSFGDGYNDAVNEIIKNSNNLDKDGEIFVNCASQLLKSFGMTRRGPFHKKNSSERLRNCWDAIGKDLIEIKNFVNKSGFSRDRYLLEISVKERQSLIGKIWLLTKELLPFTMGEATSYGLVGASKILFSVLPEIVLPVDNNEWLHVFKTVDLGDVLNYMISDIQNWEADTGYLFNDLDQSKRLTTLPSVYNVMAMDARPKI